MAQEKLAEALEADLQELRRKHESGADTASEEVESKPKAARPRIVYRRVHRTYVRVLLERELDSAYTPLSEPAAREQHCNKLP